MARDDDDDDDDRPRKRRSRDDNDDDDDDDRPSKQSERHEDNAAAKSKPMPGRLVGAIIAAMAWGILILHGSCVQSSHSVLTVARIFEMRQQQEKHLADMKKLGANFGNPQGQIDIGAPLTSLGAQIVMILMGALLLAGGITLLMRKGFGKYLAMGAPVLMILVELLAFVILLVLTRGSFFVPHNVGFLINIFFSFAVGGCIIFLLLNKEVNAALK